MTNRYDMTQEFWTQLDKSPFLMVGLDANGDHSEPLTACFDSTVPNELFFFTRKDNRLVERLGEQAQPATAQFASKGHEIFACLHGTLRKNDDPQLIDRFWSTAVQAWFDEGKDDPMLQMLELDLHEAEIWRAHLPIQGSLKMIFGGTVKREELDQQHARVTM